MNNNRDARLTVCVFLFALGMFAFSATSSFSQTCTIWVNAQTGSDTNNTGGSGSPWQTLQKAADNSIPGSTICATGTFTNPYSGATAVLTISKPGNAAQPIVFTTDPATKSAATIQLSTSDWAGIAIQTVGSSTPSYIQINNFVVVGLNAASNNSIWKNYQCTVGQTAAAQETIPGTSAPPQTTEPPCSAYAITYPEQFPQYNEAGILIDGRKGFQYASSPRPHHIWITDNQVEECGGGGIAAIQADYVIAQYNTLWDNAFYTAYGSSGISFLNAWDSYADGGVTKDLNFANFHGYHMIVDSNKVFNNFEYVPWGSYIVNNVAQITDGEGIIFDSFLNNVYTPDTISLSSYGPQSLISNNLVYRNGSAGIEIYQTNNVDVLQNSTYGNSANVIPSWTNGGTETFNGEFNVKNSHNLTVMNNIFEPASSQQSTLAFFGGDCWCYIANNDLYNGLISPSSNKFNSTFPNGDIGPNLTSNPGYLNTNLTSVWNVSLQLASNSPLLGAGQTWYVPSKSNNPDTNYPISVVGNGYPVTNAQGVSPRPNPPDIGAWQQAK